MVTEITKEYMETGIETFDTILRVVMFYGTTCGPCKRTMPEYEKVAEYFTKKQAPVLFYKINAWAPEEQKRYCELTWGVNGVPHFKAFLGGCIIATKQGGGDEETIMKFLQECIDESFKQQGVRI